MSDLHILHVDMDAFTPRSRCADGPGLRGKPVVVGGMYGRGVVCSATYGAPSACGRRCR
ncbi:MAG: hypothetical protein U1E76_19325 [Planctomycetota bacterium]